jgi:hypothetical protein
MQKYRELEINDIYGRTIIEIKHNKSEFAMTLENGDVALLHHLQECCEQFELNDVSGDVDDLINSPLIMCEMSQNDKAEPKEDFQATWTFYKLATINGYVTLRFIGESNGYYSEEVDFSINGESYIKCK